MRLDHTFAGVLVLMFAAGTSSASTFDVDPSNPGCSDVQCSPCCSIGAAIAKSIGNSTINISPGTYPEALDVRDMQTIGDLTLSASSGAGTVLVSSPSGSRGLIHGDSHTNTLTIDGVDFTSPDMSCLFIAHEGNVVLTDVTASPCGYHSFEIDATGTVTMERCTGSNSDRNGIQIDGATGITLTDCVADSNVDHGIKIYSPGGSTVITNPSTSENGDQGIDMDLYGPLTITGGTVTDNDRVGVWIWSTSTVEITGITVTGSAEEGVLVEWNGVDPVQSVTLTNVTANGNGVVDGSGIDVFEVAGPVVVNDCEANDNGLSGGGNGIIVRYVEGSVIVAGSTTNGNSRTGVRIDDLDGSVLVRDVVSNSGLEEGIKIDADIGPVTIVDSTTDGNALEGIKITSDTIELESVTLKRNVITNNLDSGVAYVGFGDTGVFDATCNDIADNDFGFYLDGDVTIDARHVWWGDPSGPGGDGPGIGNGVFAEPNGTILYDPWLVDSFTAPVSGCPIFESDFETGALAEWDSVFP
jgi:hypothetical protein